MRRHVPFQDLWSMRIEVPVSLLVRDGDLAWSCGQCPLDGDGRVLAPGDPLAQSALVCDSIEEVLRRGGLAPAAVAELLVYHCVAEASLRERMLGVFRERFGSLPLILPAALPHFYYPGMCVEVDVFAGAAPLRRSGRRDPARGFAIELVDGGALAWATLVSTGAAPEAAMAALGALLETRGLCAADLVGDHWFVAPGEAARDDGEAAIRAFARAGLVTDPGSMALSLDEEPSRVAAALTFARGGAGPSRLMIVEEGTLVLSTRRHGDFLWAAARSRDVHLDLVGQTEAVMEALAQALAGHSCGFRDVVKSTTHYVGPATPEDLHRNMAVRNRRYAVPGPASTGVPVAHLGDPHSLIAVDLTARIGKSEPAVST